MRRHLRMFLLLTVCFGGAVVAGAEPVSLYETLSRRLEVKVFVAAPTDTTEKKGLEPAVLKTALERSFTERKSIRFRIVASESEADLVLDSQIEGFMFSETDPVDMLIGVGAAALDAVTNEHFASAKALFSVRDAKTGAVSWKDEVQASVTDAAMTEAESKTKVSERLGEMLMRQAFGKKKK